MSSDIKFKDLTKKKEADPQKLTIKEVINFEKHLEELTDELVKELKNKGWKLTDKKVTEMRYLNCRYHRKRDSIFSEPDLSGLLNSLPIKPR